MNVISVDLLEAAERSDTFPSTWDGERRREALARYQKFLGLAAAHPGVPLAPTRDIDEMWHLHMLAPRAYVADCERLLGYVLDHDGGFGKKPEELPVLGRTFARTAELWQRTYGEPYVEGNDGQISCWHDCQSRCWHACSS